MSLLRAMRIWFSKLSSVNICLKIGVFDNISFSLCVRECNEVAYRLARWASNSNIDNVWIDSSPNWIRDIVINIRFHIQKKKE